VSVLQAWILALIFGIVMLFIDAILIIMRLTRQEKAVSAMEAARKARPVGVEVAKFVALDAGERAFAAAVASATKLGDGDGEGDGGSGSGSGSSRALGLKDAPRDSSSDVGVRRRLPVRL
jgi:hypothetical protein